MGEIKIHNPCPVCNQTGRRRMRRQMTRAVAVAYYQCTNVDCSASWAEQSEITHMLSLGPALEAPANIPFRPSGRPAAGQLRLASG